MAELNDDFWQDENRRLRKILSPLIRAAALAGAEWALDDLGVLAAGLDWGLVNKAVVAWAQEYAGNLVDGITMTSRLFVKEQIVSWIESGQPLDDLIDALTPMFGQVRAEMIGVTEVTRTFAEGNIAAWRESNVVSGKRWMTGRDELVCEICAPLDGMIVDLTSDGFTTESGDEAIGLFAPPAHVNCLPGDAFVLPIGTIAAGSKRVYQGDMVVIKTLEYQLAVTPNHPILTPGGWVAAGDIKHGDHVITYDPANWETALIGVDNKQPISRIKDVFGSLGLVEFRVPATPPDFHGDGGNSNIAVVRPNSHIGNDIDPGLVNPIAQLDFIPGSVESSSVLAGSASTQFIKSGNTTPGGGISSRDLIVSPLDIHTRPLDGLGLGSIAGGNTSFDKTPTESDSIDSDLFSQKIFGLPGLIASQEIIEVGNYYFTGHVYNLQTESGIFIANGIITHNCRCYLQPFVTVE